MNGSKPFVLPLHHPAIIIILVREVGFVPTHLSVLVSKTDAAALTPFTHMVELRRIELLSRKSLLTTNLILTLQVLYISFDPHLFTKYQSQERVLILKLSTQESIRINLFVRQSLSRYDYAFSDCLLILT